MGGDKGQSLTFKFSNSGVLQTYTRDPELVAELSSNREKYPLTCYSSKIVHTPEVGFELITDTQSEPPRWINNLKNELGMPRGALLRHLTTRGSIFGVRWQNYNLRFLGIVLQPEAVTECSWPYWRISDVEGNDIEHVQVWYQRAACFTSSVFCDVRWHPSRGELVSFPGLEHARRGREVTLAWRGRVLLRKINPRGRPESSVTLTQSQFIERAPQACAKLFNTYGEMPTDVQIAEELQISRATLYRYMGRYNLSLNQIRDIAIRVPAEPVLF